MMSMTSNQGKWDKLFGPARVPTRLTPTDRERDGVSWDNERAELDELKRRLLAFELDPVNFFKIGRK
jgi:hypothetical protein